MAEALPFCPLLPPREKVCPPSVFIPPRRLRPPAPPTRNAQPPLPPPPPPPPPRPPFASFPVPPPPLPPGPIGRGGSGGTRKPTRPARPPTAAPPRKNPARARPPRPPRPTRNPAPPPPPPTTPPSPTTREQPRRVAHYREGGAHVRRSRGTNRQHVVPNRQIVRHQRIDLLRRNEEQRQKAVAHAHRQSAHRLRQHAVRRHQRLRRQIGTEYRHDAPRRHARLRRRSRRIAHPRRRDIRHRLEHRLHHPRRTHCHDARWNRAAQVALPTPEFVPGLHLQAHRHTRVGSIEAVRRFRQYAPHRSVHRIAGRAQPVEQVIIRVQCHRALTQCDRQVARRSRPAVEIRARSFAL